MSKDEQQQAPSRIESIWGTAILDEGFSVIPNIVTRTYKKAGITPSEWTFITAVLSYKHTAAHPFPSHDQIADDLDISRRAVIKIQDQIEAKGLLRIGRRKNKIKGGKGSNLYDFSPLLKKCLEIRRGDIEEQQKQNDFDIDWGEPKKAKKPKGKGKKQCVPQVHIVVNRNVYHRFTLKVKKGSHWNGKKVHIKRQSSKRQPSKRQSIYQKAEKMKVSDSIKELVKKQIDRLKVYHLTVIEKEYKESGLNQDQLLTVLENVFNHGWDDNFTGYLRASIKNFKNPQPVRSSSKGATPERKAPDWLKGQDPNNPQELDKATEKENAEWLDRLLNGEIAAAGSQN